MVSIEVERRRASRIDAALLQAQAVLAGIALGGVLVTADGGPFGVGQTAAGFIVLAVLSAFAAVAEWNRERLAETVALAAGTLGVVMGIVGGFAALWYVAPILTATAVGVCLATTRRLLVRDEARHRPSAR